MNSSKKFFRLLITALLSMVALHYLRSGDCNASGQPNLVLVLVDDLGKEWVSCFGAGEIKTPRLDSMAREGLMLNHVYSMPQCTPSRVALLTGQYPYRNGWVNHWDVPRWGAGCHFDPSSYPVVLGRAMKQAGYATAAAGKWQIDDFRVEPDAMAEAGFDDWCMWAGGEAGNPASDERYWNPYIAQRGHPTGTRHGQFGPDVYNQFLLDFISSKSQSGEPYFIYYPMTLVHTPFVTTPTEPEARGNLEKHKAMVRYMDLLVGRLIDHIKQQQTDRKTIVIWTTDNGTVASITGTLNGRRVQGGKSKTIESGVNAPTICWGPGVVPVGVASDALIDFTDMLPTLLELAGQKQVGDPDRRDVEVDINNVIDGVSFASVLRGNVEARPRNWILAMGGGNHAQVTATGVENQWWFRDRVLRSERYKVFIGPDRKPTRLLDLVQDPTEQQNILGHDDDGADAFLQQVTDAVAKMPARDCDPIYNPNPKQPWDRPVTKTSLRWKLGQGNDVETERDSN